MIASQLCLIHAINSRLITLRSTSPLLLFPPQNQALYFGAKQMALQCCTNMLYLSQDSEG
ncbi:hypothetical protein SCLCIDRAFT_1216077 [Scleroderma citrinum Foug A]|uniref:Uncharacterized protein n=1 Tax=Scleroderma citrinum Foug A TaxID=1036808 RepID=A0A0C3DKT7_9AGAM|nr:hypothetical protein SCLCIDRAFT_1216077 [Scleroderma citrinum Foug A]